MLEQERLDRLLAAVEKPARYLGGEWNEIVKEEARLRFALSLHLQQSRQAAL